MTRLLLSTAVAGVLMFAGAAMGQPADDRDHHGQPPAGGHAPAPAAHAPAAPAAGADHRPPAAGNAMRGPATPPPAAAMRGPGSAVHGPGAGEAMRGPGPAARGPGEAMRGPAPAPGGAMRGPGPGMAMHGPGPAHNFTAYNRNVTAAHRFHAQSYHRPHGWYAHRWTFGEMLPALFWSQDFWINDYVDFGLMPPPPGTVWVRDGSDAILIDQTDGEIIQVNYGVFY